MYYGWTGLLRAVGGEEGWVKEVGFWGQADRAMSTGRVEGLW